MLTQEKSIIETILADVGLEPLLVEDNDQELKNELERVFKAKWLKRIP
jgi:hypothetical protein